MSAAKGRLPPSLHLTQKTRSVKAIFNPRVTMRDTALTWSVAQEKCPFVGGSSQALPPARCWDRSTWSSRQSWDPKLEAGTSGPLPGSSVCQMLFRCEPLSFFCIVPFAGSIGEFACCPGSFFLGAPSLICWVFKYYGSLWCAFCWGWGHPCAGAEPSGAVQQSFFPQETET